MCTFQDRPRAPEVSCATERPPIPGRPERKALLCLAKPKRTGLGAAREVTALASLCIESSLRRRTRLLDEGAGRGQRRVDVDSVIDEGGRADAAEGR